MLPSPAPAEVKTVYICAITSGTSEELKDYVRSVLSEALERTSAHYGAYEVRLLPDMERKRIIYELKHGASRFNSAIFPLDVSLNADLLPVRIPVERGILGLRLMMVRVAVHPHKTGDDLDEDPRKLRIGVLPAWAETRIIRYNGFKTVDGASAEGLLKMLDVGRVDALDRSAVEIGPEFSRIGAEYPNLAIERHFALYSPVPVYFWFANDDKGKILAERVRIGLDSMVEDHSLEALFHQAFDSILQPLNIKDRQIIHMVNPDIGPMDPVDDDRYWFVGANHH